ARITELVEIINEGLSDEKNNEHMRSAIICTSIHLPNMIPTMIHPLLTTNQYRQRNNKLRPLSFFAFHGNRSVMRFDDIIAEGKTKTCSLSRRLRGEE